MSAKLLKSLANGKCNVENIISGEIIVYWPEDGKLRSITIPAGGKLDLLLYATVAQLRKSPNLSKLVGPKLRVL